jgi:PAS domain S-box-containing protein
MVDSAGTRSRVLADGGRVPAGIDFQTLFRTISIPTIVLDHNGEILVWNEAQEDLVGVDREQVANRDGEIGEELYESGRSTVLAEKVLTHPHDAHERYDTVRIAEDDYSLLVGGDAPVFEDYSTVDVSGAGVWFLATAIYRDGELVGVIEFTQPELASERRNVEIDQLVGELAETLQAYQEGRFGVRASIDSDLYIIEEELLELIDRTNELGANLERMEELRDSKKRLEELNTRLQLALEETDTGVWEWDLDTDELLWDEASERLYGYDAGAFPGSFEAFADHVLAEDLPSVERRIERAMVNDKQFRADFRIRLSSGGKRWLQSRGIVEYDDGEPTRMLGVQTDITDLKEYEQELEEQRDNLEVLNQIVRHDIRNKLQLVGGYAEMLRTEIGADDRKEIEQITEAVSDAISITTTTREVMEVMLQSDVDCHPVRLRPVLEEEIENVRSNHGSASIGVDGSLPAVDVRADDMLASVFRNLLTNAIRHNDKEVPEVTVSATGREGHGSVLVRIADNGPGIPDEHKPEIFEQGEIGPDSGGSGLGLHLVDTLVGHYDGEVRVEDNDPDGTVFAVELPTVTDRDSY